MQNKFGIIGLAVGIIVLGVLLFLSTRVPIANTEIVPSGKDNSVVAIIVPFTKLMEGTQSKIAERVNYTIVSSNELSELWKMIGATGKLPVIDFERQTVLAVFAGSESLSSIAVAKIEDTKERMVSISITKLEGACAEKIAAKSPYEIVVVPVTSLPFTHTDVLTTVPCRN